MLLNKQNLEIAKLVDTTASRYKLNAIHVSPKWTAVTNGHYLVTVTLPEAEDAQFPSVDGFTPTNGATPAFLLNPETALEVAKALPKRTTIPILSNASVGTKDGERALAVTDLEAPKVFQPNPIEGQFPNIEAVIPKSAEAKLTIGFDAAYLMKLCKSALDTCKFRSGVRVGIKMEFRDASSTVKMTAHNPDTHQEWMAVLMPMRI